MRLFIAISLGRVIKERIGAVQEEFRRQRVRGNYTPAENLHITLAFIGEYGDPDRVLDAMSSVRFQPFRITLDGIGRFDQLWWTGLAKSPELEKLAHNVRYALAENGIPFDRKRFRPHITILRKPEYTQGEPQGIDVDSVSMTVDGISLMRSDRGKNGMIYTEVGYVSADEEAVD